MDVLPDEMLGEVWMWLNTRDRVRLQRVSRRFHSLFPGALVCAEWREIYAACTAPALVASLIDARLDQRVPPSVYLVQPHALTLQWLQLPLAAMQDGAIIPMASVDEVTVVNSALSAQDLQYLTRYYDRIREPPPTDLETLLGVPFGRAIWKYLAVALTDGRDATELHFTRAYSFQGLSRTEDIGTVVPGFAPFSGRFDYITYDYTFRESYRAAKMPRLIRFKRNHDMYADAFAEDPIRLRISYQALMEMIAVPPIIKQ